MDGFSQIFKQCEADARSADIEMFRESATYAFAFQDGPTDLGALKIACEQSIPLSVHYMSLPKSHSGYTQTITYKPIDRCDSRHMMMSSIIFSYIDTVNHIVEIGGGYGNWLRLNAKAIPFKKWSIIDLPFMLDLQKWYLTQENVDQTCIEYVSARNYTDWAIQHQNFDLVIGAHSLSELSWEDFDEYFNKILMKTDYFFYATHLFNCGPKLLVRKLKKIAGEFEEIKNVSTENGNVMNILYRRRSAMTS